MSRSLFFWFLSLIFGMVIVAPCAVAQSGSIEGVVADPSDARIQGAAVTVTETQTGLTRELVTDDEGRFAALGLPPGIYSLHVSKSGFQVLERTGVNLAAGRAIRLPLSLALGESVETVVVEGEAPLVSASVADAGGRVDEQDLQSQPLNGRDLFELAALQSGVSNVRAARRGQNQGFGSQLSVNGGRPSTNSFKMDGIYVNDSTNSVPVSSSGQSVGLETVRELHIVTNPYSAEFGRGSGGTITAVSKSGSNQFHGSVYEYFRNSSLDARNFFDAPNEPIPPLRRNQFGAVIGGPIRKNRAFFLVNYEGIREQLGSTALPVVPTLEARQGFLPTGDGGVEQVPIDPAVVPYLDLYPLPNGRDFGDGSAEYVTEIKQELDENYVSGKVDFLFSPLLRLSSRYTVDDAAQVAPDPLDLWNISNDSRYQFVHGNLQQIASARTIVNYRAAFSQVRNAENALVQDDAPDNLSFLPGQPLGSLRVTGLAEIGGSDILGRPRRFENRVLQFSSEATHVRGANRLRFGGGYYRTQYRQLAVRGAVGEYRFRSLRDFFAARTQRGEALAPDADASRVWTNHQFVGYIQNEFQLGSRLSLSLGVRYETATVPNEKDGKIATLRDPLHDSELTIGGPAYLNPSKRNFAPRASLAWDPFGTGNTVVRASGGIFYDLLGSRHLALAGVRMPPFFRRFRVNGAEFPDLTTIFSGPEQTAAIDTLQFDMQQPYVARWQFGIERQFGPRTVAEVIYAGSRGIHLMGVLGTSNPVVPDVQPDGTLVFPENGTRVNPAFESVGMRRPQFNSFYHGFTTSLRHQWSDRLRFDVNYRLGKSIDETSSDVLTDFNQEERFPTVFDYRQNRGASAFDTRHALNAKFSLLLPGPVHGPARHLIGGWQLHGVVQAQSGNPFTPWVGFDRANVDAGVQDLGQRPDLAAAPGANLILGDPQRWFDPLGFSLPAEGRLGNLGRGTLTGPNLLTLDLGVEKRLWGEGRHSARLRGEFFNVTNRPNFAIPDDLALFNPNGSRVGVAGRISRTVTTSRQVQLALRWEF